jgi:hypothetical protein
MAHQIYKANLGIKCKGTKNRWFKLGGSVDENLTGCLQRHVVPGYDRNRNDFYFEYKQHDVSNNSQRASFWFSSKKSRYRHFYLPKILNNQICRISSHSWTGQNSWNCSECKNVMNISNISAAWDVKYLKWIWASDAKERGIDDSNWTDRATKIWQCAWKDT